VRHISRKQILIGKKPGPFTATIEFSFLKTGKRKQSHTISKKRIAAIVLRGMNGDGDFEKDHGTKDPGDRIV